MISKTSFLGKFCDFKMLLITYKMILLSLLKIAYSMAYLKYIIFFSLSVANIDILRSMKTLLERFPSNYKIFNATSLLF